jgi:hypothetical protein
MTLRLLLCLLAVWSPVGGVAPISPGLSAVKVPAEPGPGAQARALRFDCNGNGIEDAVDIAVGASVDANGNGIPDECETGSAAELGGPGSGCPDAGLAAFD